MPDSKQRGSEHRGFAAMDAEKQRQIASKGGKAAHQKGTAHEFSSEEARAAGRKGGEARARHAQSIAARNGAHAHMLDDEGYDIVHRTASAVRADDGAAMQAPSHEAGGDRTLNMNGRDDGAGSRF